MSSTQLLPSRHDVTRHCGSIGYLFSQVLTEGGSEQGATTGENGLMCALGIAAGA